MRLKEQQLWDAMRRGVNSAEVRLERLENLASVGMPDIVALSFGRVTMVENKAVHEFPKRASTRVFGADGLSIAQRNWLLDWTRHGGESLIVAGVGAGVGRRLYAVEGRLADVFNAMTRDDLQTRAAIAGGGVGFWLALAARLRGAE